MDLHSGRRRIGGSWTVLPWSDAIIAKVEALATDENQPRMHNGPVFEFRPNVPVDDLDVVENIDVYDLPQPPEPILPVPLFQEVVVPDEPLTDQESVDGSVDGSIMSDEGARQIAEPADGIVAEEGAAQHVVDEANPFHILDVDAVEEDENELLQRQMDGLVDSLANYSEDTNSVSSDASVEDPAIKTLQHDLEEAEHGYNLRPRSGPSFNSYRNPQPQFLQFKASKAAKLPTFEQIRAGYNPTEEELKGLAYKFVVDHAMNDAKACMTQMSAEKGFKVFGERAVDALMKEFAQLDDMDTFKPLDAKSLTADQRQMALRLINLIKEKRDKSLKGQTCVDGRPQREYINKEDASSPTVSNEAFMLCLNGI